jgi:peptide/nickel transport system permease protein
VLFPLIPLTVLHAVVLLAGFFAPYAPERQNRDFGFAPPTRVRFVDSTGQLHFRPFVYGLRAQPDGSYSEDQSRIFEVHFFFRGDAYRIAGVWQSQLHLFGVMEPGVLFVMGSDDYGRDQLSRFLSGAQISLMAGPLAALLALSIGTLLGAVSGFCGRITDSLVMAAAELFLALPWFYLLLGIRALLPLDLGPRQAFLMIVSVLGVIGWARPARLVRGVVLSAKQREFVQAARGFGASDFYLIRRHVLPQASGVLLMQAALLVPQYVIAEVTMSFLGLGVSEPAASWGLMLTGVRHYHALVSRWWMWLPALLLIPVFFAYYALAAALGGLDVSQIRSEYRPRDARPGK